MKNLTMNFEIVDGGQLAAPIKKLAVRGGDIARLGYRGEKIGEALNALLYAVIDGRVENEKTALIEYLNREGGSL